MSVYMCIYVCTHVCVHVVCVCVIVYVNRAHVKFLMVNPGNALSD